MTLAGDEQTTVRHADGVYTRVRQAILHGELAPGEELSQVRLARRLGVSRTPLREALHMLLHEGLVEGKPGQQLRVVGYSVQDMEQLYVQRVTLEAIAARITVPRTTDADIQHMDDLLRELEDLGEREDYAGWEIAHQALHRSFWAASGARMLAMLTQLYEHAERYRRLYTTQAAKAWAVGPSQHQRIVDAFRARDVDETSRALAEHLGVTALGVIGLIEPDFRLTALRTAIAAASAPLPRDTRP
jgi:DNA-binding GntR family transcriptional regulator